MSDDKLTIDDSYEEMDNEDFGKMLEQSLNRSDDFATGQKVNGTIVGFSDEHAFIDISGKSEAIININELKNEEGEFQHKKGDTIEAFIVSTSGGEINLTSVIGKGSVTPQIIQMAYKNNIPVEGRVAESIKGGFSVYLSETRCFCPFSQMGARKNSDESEFLNKKFMFKIIQYTERGKNIVVSRRALLDEARKSKEEELKQTLNVGDTITGTIQTKQNFGLFVDIGGIEALVPKSEISRSRYKSLKSFEIGEEVTANVLSIDWETSKISLSMKALEEDPWDSIDELKIDETYEGVVVNIIKTGAFIELKPGLEGFIHISRLSLIKKVNRPEDVLSRGDSVSVRLVDINTEQKKMSLELITNEPNPWNQGVESLTGTNQTGIIEISRSSGINVRLENGMLGYVPKEELTRNKGADIQNEFPVGKEIEVAIVRLIPEERKLILSCLGAKKNEEMKEYQNFKEKSDASGGTTLGDLFKNKFEKLQKDLDK